MNVAYFSYSNTPDPTIGSLTYTVTDETGAPVAGVTVNMKGEAIRKTLTAVTDGNGVASFGSVVLDHYDVSLSGLPEGYESTEESKAEVEFGKAESSFSGSLKVRRACASSVTYTVKDQTGAAAANVEVTLSGQAKAGGNVSMTTTTGADGKAVFQNVPFGSYEVYVSKAPEGYQASDKKAAVSVASKDAVAVNEALTVTKKEEATTEEPTTEETPAETTTAPETPGETTTAPETPAETTTAAPETPAETTTAAPETPAETTTAAPETPATTTAAETPASTTEAAAAESPDTEAPNQEGEPADN